VIVIPWFLIPGRPYPIQVYLYACALYSATPEIGQRGVAKSTREKFKLDNFSHSTVSRSFKSFEWTHKQELEKKFGEEAMFCRAESPMLISAASKPCAGGNETRQSERRVPTIASTLIRRKNMGEFFPKCLCELTRAGIESVSIQFVEGWHKKTRKLLL